MMDPLAIRIKTFANNDSRAESSSITIDIANGEFEKRKSMRKSAITKVIIDEDPFDKKLTLKQ